MRVELLLELSGLSRQEIIVIKACAPDAKSFESVAATLVEQYSGVHLREGRSLGHPNLRNSGNLQTRSGRPFGYRPKGKGKTDICVYSVLFPCFHSTYGYICCHFCLKHNSQLVALHARFLAVDMLSVFSSSMHINA